MSFCIRLVKTIGMLLTAPFICVAAGNLISNMIMHVQLLGKEWQEVIEVRRIVCLLV